MILKTELTVRAIVAQPQQHDYIFSYNASSIKQ